MIHVSNLQPNVRFNFSTENVEFKDCSVVRTSKDGVEEGYVVCVGKNSVGCFELFVLSETDEVQPAPAR